MSAYETEEQQLEALKKWWQENSKPLIIGIVLGFVALFGGKAWLNYQDTRRMSASAEYQQLAIELQQHQAEAVTLRAEHIIETFPSTPYAALAALALAKVKAEAGELAAARSKLQWVLDNAAQPEIKHVARLRLARAMMADGQAAAALTLLNDGGLDVYGALYHEIKGDVYVAMGQYAQARDAYSAALATLSPSADRRSLQMKLDDLGA